MKKPSREKRPDPSDLEIARRSARAQRGLGDVGAVVGEIPSALDPRFPTAWPGERIR